MIGTDAKGSPVSEYILSQIVALNTKISFLINNFSKVEDFQSFINNWIRLNRLYKRVQVHMSNPEVVDRLVRSNLLLTAELIAVGHTINVLNNLTLCCLKNQQQAVKSDHQ